jgi:hypothetical protein
MVALKKANGGSEESYILVALTKKASGKLLKRTRLEKKSNQERKIGDRRQKGFPR